MAFTLRVLPTVAMDNYKVIKALGQGTWGVVHMAEQKATGRVVAIKKIKSENYAEGVNFTAIREIKVRRFGSSRYDAQIAVLLLFYVSPRISL